MISDTAQIDLAIVLSRALVLTIAALAGALSIYLGYRLYIRGVESETSGSVERAKLSAKLSAGGPGVFFALFGMGILIYLVLHSAEIETIESPASTPITYTSPDADDLRLIKLPNAKPAPAPPQCIVYRRKLRFGNAGQIAKAEAGEAMRRGKSCLSKLDFESMSELEAKAFNRSITVLDEMSESLDPDDAPKP